jgi:hypothetical protein
MYGCNAHLCWKGKEGEEQNVHLSLENYEEVVGDFLLMVANQRKKNRKPVWRKWSTPYFFQNCHGFLLDSLASFFESDLDWENKKSSVITNV